MTSSPAPYPLSFSPKLSSTSTPHRVSRETNLFRSVGHFESFDPGSGADSVGGNGFSWRGSPDSGGVRGSGGGGRGGGRRKRSLMPDRGQLDLNLGVGGMGSDAALSKRLRQMTTSGELTTALMILHQNEQSRF